MRLQQPGLAQQQQQVQQAVIINQNMIESRMDASPVMINITVTIRSPLFCVSS
jgi:hypothetical protein